MTDPVFALEERLIFNRRGLDGDLTLKIEGDWSFIARAEVKALIAALQHHLDSTPMCGEIDAMSAAHRSNP